MPITGISMKLCTSERHVSRHLAEKRFQVQRSKVKVTARPKCTFAAAEAYSSAVISLFIKQMTNVIQ